MLSTWLVSISYCQVVKHRRYSSFLYNPNTRALSSFACTNSLVTSLGSKSLVNFLWKCSMVRAESLSWDMVLLNQSLNRRSAEKLLCRRRCGHTHQDVQEDENLGDHQLSFFGELLHKVNDVNEIFGGRALGVEVRKLLFQLVDVNVPSRWIMTSRSCSLRTVLVVAAVRISLVAWRTNSAPLD